MQGMRPVGMNYRKFTEGILSELPIEEQTRILRHAEKVYSLRQSHTRKKDSAGLMGPPSADETSNTEITGFSQRYTKSQKGKGKEKSPVQIFHVTGQPEKEISDPVIAEQIAADEILARCIAQSGRHIRHTPDFTPQIGPSGARHLDNTEKSSTHSAKLSSDKKCKRTGSPSYIDNLPGVYQLRNAIPGGKT
ncbi:hypothetical protein M422DRAFT_255236 [Sphaerobolus stellatus SS14]|uniref:Uncharacterized protein n=1 Tax=Sphaerobolus stellatus (strain SS14) TaxID=990650 RepID=A0A0C9V3W6_SPHS4|nr:hypothetical protein M422DRAFT_255236 [Sphaerobolus stellatus SS14]